MDELKLLIDKLSQYNFVANILPGTVLCIVLKYVVGYELFVIDDWYLMGIVFYFVGMVNNRIGSLVVEPLLEKCHIIKKTPYCDFVAAEKKDSKITILSMENNVFRSYISVCLIALLSLVYKRWFELCEFLANNKEAVLLVALLLLFICAYRKQTSYVKKRVESNK